jgi:hypothetical protein
MKFLFSVLALAIGALTFQSCEVYPNGIFVRCMSLSPQFDPFQDNFRSLLHE